MENTAAIHLIIKIQNLKAMKTLFFIPLFFLASLVCAENEVILNSKAKKVTVFMNSAQVTRYAAFNSNPGITTLVFEGVSPYIDIKSMQASGKGDYIILDVQYRVKDPVIKEPVSYEIPAKIVKNIETLEDSLVNINFEIDDLISKKDVLLLEKKTLLGNKFMQGNADTIPELKSAMEYLRKQLNDINNALNIIKRQEYKLQSQKTRMETRLNELKNYNAWQNPVVPELPVHQILVTIQSKATVAGSITVNYSVQNAGWTPLYDIRATSASQPVKLVQKANVYQNTGEDWKDVKLTLSTITPSSGMAKPVLPVYYLGYNYYLNNNKQCRDQKRYEYAGSVAARAVDDYEVNALTSAIYTQTNQTLTNAEFEIDLSYTIPADGKPHMIAVKEHSLKAEFVHYIMPEISKHAWLVAKISDWNNLDLLSANANIYFDGTFVGETTVSTGMFSDTLELALGTDRSIVVERKRNKEEQKNAIIGTNIIKTVSYTLNIRNSKYSEVNLVVEDRMPVSNDAGVKVQKVNISGAEHNEISGLLTWKTKVSSGQTKAINFSYSIEYDKNKPLAIL